MASTKEPVVKDTPARSKSHSHVKWAPEPGSESERRPLLDDDIERANEDDEDEDDSNGSASRLHRKSKLGLLLGGGRRHSFSSISDEERAALKRRRWWVYAVAWALLALLVVGVIIGAMALDKDDHPTGPYPEPPRHSSAPSGTFSVPHVEPTGKPRNPAYMVKASNGAVATENEICSEMGVDILKANGCGSFAR